MFHQRMVGRLVLSHLLTTLHHNGCLFSNVAKFEVAEIQKYVVSTVIVDNI